MIPFQISLPFKPIVKKNGNYIINFVTLRLTKVKLLKITSFLPFLTQIRQKFGPKRPLNLAFLAIIAINFHAGGFTTCFVTFFITLDLIQTKFCPKTTPDLIFFAKTLLKPLTITTSRGNLCKNGVPIKPQPQFG